MKVTPTLICAFAVFVVIIHVPCDSVAQAVPAAGTREREVAAAFAPIFYQALGDKPRSDYITKFDFDGDWRGDNNWLHADNIRFPLNAYVYYSVAETATHFFVHYAVYHPRDYKGGETKGAILSELMREGVRRGGRYDPTGIAEETSLAHENDMEGCLIVIEKDGTGPNDGKVKYVQTFGHGSFSKYVTESANGFQSVKLERQRALLYIEPKGHGIQALGNQKLEKKFVVYRFMGRAEDATRRKSSAVGYQLVNLDILWSKAGPGKNNSQNNLTFGEFHDYGVVTLNLAQANGRISERRINLGSRGASLLGKVGGINMARPPWGWFERDNRQERGRWFFDPATAIKRDFKLPNTFSTAYVRPPFWAN